MKKYLLIFTLFISVTTIFANTYYLTVNLGSGLPNDFETIYDAIHSINIQPDYCIGIDVYPDFDGFGNPTVTPFYETVSIPICAFFTLRGVTGVEGFEPRDYVILDSYDPANWLFGNTAISIVPGPFWAIYEVTISGFTIQRSGNPFAIDCSGIVALSRTVNIYNCKFGTRSENNNFHKAIYYYNDAGKVGMQTIKIGNNIFDEACDLGEETIYLDGDVFSGLSYVAIINGNQFTNCGKGMWIHNSYIYHIDYNELNNIEDFSSQIDSEMEAIYAHSAISSLLYSFIEYNDIDNFEYGIISSTNDDYHYINYNELTNVTNGINAEGANSEMQLTYNLVQCKLLNDPLDESVGITISTYPTDFLFNTIVNTDQVDGTIGIKYEFGTTSYDIVNSCILWDFDTKISLTSGELTLKYCCLQDIEGLPNNINTEIGNIEDDPMFVDPENNFKLAWIDETNHSPCIDTADPTYPLDPDGSPPDMGCYYFDHPYDTKTFSPGWQWVSFPKLTLQYEYQGTYYSLIGESYEQAYYENGDPGLLQDTYQGNPTINGFFRIDGKRDEEMYIKYIEDVFVDHLFGNMLFRHEGYKIQVEEGADPTTLIVDGERLEPTHVINGTLAAGIYHWLGYWIPYTQDIDVAFGSGTADDFWQYVEVVKAEEWTYMDMNSNRGTGDPEPKPSMRIRPLDSGKSYMVKFNEPVEDFHWADSNNPSEGFKRQESENFTYEEKADYEVIDVMGIDPSVTEIGVFEGDECVGVVVVQDSCEQILVYSDNANRDPIPFNFEVIMGRGISVPILNYTIFNQRTGKYEPGLLISGHQEYSAVRLGEEEKPENIITKPMLHGNYPNPFNPTTTISFSLPKEEDIELIIYNIKGQKVKTLYSGIAEEGKHTMIWEGKDSNDKPVSSGIYFYKLKTGKQELTRKMLLLK